MMNKKASVAKWVALAVVPLSLAAVVVNVAQKRRAEAATEELYKLWTQQVVEPASLERLVQLGADVSKRDKLGRGALHYAAYHGPSATKIVLDQGVDVNAQDKFGNTALMSAVSDPHSESVQLLLSKGANPNLQAWPGISGLEDRKITALSLAQEGAAASSVDDDEKIHTLRILRMLKAAGAKE